MKHLIWSNTDINVEDWDIEGNFLSDTEKFEKISRLNEEYLEDERANLDISFSEDIIGIANLGLWNGRFPAYKRFKGNIAECLHTCCERAKWYVDDNGEFRCDEYHHDGSNHILYRKFKFGVDEEAIEKLEEEIIKGNATMEYIDRLTEKLGYTIADVYGWQLGWEC